MRVCPQCDATYNADDEQLEVCPVDGARLIDRPRPGDPDEDPMMGRTVAGRFKIVGFVGSGGMGTVYRAEQQPVGREVALKVLKRDLAANEEAVARFHREAKAASLLRDPHTVTLFDFGQDDDGLLFLAMELLEGEPLTTRIDSAIRLDWQEALDIAHQVCESLAEAHEQGIVHRDLKPDNLYFSFEAGGRERVKVLDFGIARVVEPIGDDEATPTLTQKGTVFGTPAYMSPEQAKARKVDGRADLYSLGALLYELLTGSPPFDADSVVMLLSKQIAEPPRPFEDAAPEIEVPPAVEKLVLQLLEKDPDERPQSAREVIQEIDTLKGNSAEWSFPPPTQPTGNEAPPATVSEGPAEPTVDGPAADEKPPPGRPVPIIIAVIVVILLGGLAATWAAGLFGDSGATSSVGPADSAPTSAPSGSDAAAARDAAVELVEIELSATPGEARFLVDDEPLEGNPARLSRPRSDEEHRLRVEAPGHETQRRTLVFDRSRTLQLSLTPDAAPETDAQPDADEQPRRPPRRHVPIITTPP